MQVLSPWSWFIVCVVCAGFVGDGGLVAAAADNGPRALLLTGKYEEAERAFRELAGDHPVMAAIGVSHCQQATGKRVEALATLLAAHKSHEQASDLEAEMALLHFEAGDYEQASGRVASVLAADSESLAARWLSAELDRVSGRLDEANQKYEWFIDYYNRTDDFDDPQDLRYIALAAAQYARWNRASDQFSFLVNDLLPAALKLDPNYWPAHLEMALLFMEKFNKPDAQVSLNAALAINPHAAEVHAARARLALQDFDLPTAQSALGQAQRVNPNLLSLRQLRADVALVDLRPQDAVQILAAAKKLQPHDEATLGRLAAAYGAVDGFSRQDADARMQQLIDEAVARNEHCGEFFRTLAQSIELMRKFPFAVDYYEQSLQRMPQQTGVRGELGLLYMRLGDEIKGRQLLSKSFEIDPFNVRVRNTLEVLDVLDGYAVMETDHFVIKFDRGHDDVFAQYAADYLETTVYPEIVQSLGYEPAEKSLFEFFSRAKNTSGHGWFSARMVGLPYIGTVGACAGRMVAMVSPNDMEKPFNWARVLKHEFVHVVNLQQTDFNIPHWYTEALAVYHEDARRPASWNQVLARRTRAGQLFDLSDINFGFMRPQSGEDWTLAYCQAELYAEYMIATYGPESLAKMLRAYADNLTTPDAVKHCFQVSVQEFEQGYAAYVQAIVDTLPATFGEPTRTLQELEAALQQQPDEPALLAEMALALLLRGDTPRARQRALQAQERQKNQPLAAYVMARIYLSIGDLETAKEKLRQGFDEESPHPRVLSLLAAISLKNKDFANAERLYKIGADKYPHDDNWLKSLARVYLTAGGEELSEVLAELAMRDSDDVTMRKKLAQLALADKDFAAAAEWSIQALRIDVMDSDAHAMLAAARFGMSDYQAAVDEYEMAIRIGGEKQIWRDAHDQALKKIHDP